MRLLHLAPALLLASGLAAHADILQYTFVQAYPNQPVNTFSFQLPSNPTSQQLMVNAAQQYFAVTNVAATVDGIPGTFLAVFNFNLNGTTPGIAGGLVLAGPFYNPNEPTISEGNYGNQPLYSGEPFAPTFLTGTFTLQEFGAPYGGALGILTVTDISTPEPSSLALLTTGVLGAAGLLRRRVVPKP